MFYNFSLDIHINICPHYHPDDQHISPSRRPVSSYRHCRIIQFGDEAIASLLSAYIVRVEVKPSHICYKFWEQIKIWWCQVRNEWRMINNSDTRTKNIVMLKDRLPHKWTISSNSRFQFPQNLPAPFRIYGGAFMREFQMCHNLNIRQDLWAWFHVVAAVSWTPLEQVILCDEGLRQTPSCLRGWNGAPGLILSPPTIRLPTFIAHEQLSTTAQPLLYRSKSIYRGTHYAQKRFGIKVLELSPAPAPVICHLTESCSCIIWRFSFNEFSTIPISFVSCS